MELSHTNLDPERRDKKQLVFTQFIFLIWPLKKLNKVVDKLRKLVSYRIKPTRF